MAVCTDAMRMPSLAIIAGSVVFSLALATWCTPMTSQRSLNTGLPELAGYVAVP